MLFFCRTQVPASYLPLLVSFFRPRPFLPKRVHHTSRKIAGRSRIPSAHEMIVKAEVDRAHGPTYLYTTCPVQNAENHRPEQTKTVDASWAQRNAAACDACSRLWHTRTLLSVYLPSCSIPHTLNLTHAPPAFPHPYIPQSAHDLSKNLPLPVPVRGIPRSTAV